MNIVERDEKRAYVKRIVEAEVDNWTMGCMLEIERQKIGMNYSYYPTAYLPNGLIVSFHPGNHEARHYIQEAHEQKENELAPGKPMPPETYL